MKPKKCERYKPSSSQTPYEIDPSVEPAIGDGQGTQSLKKEVVANTIDHEPFDKDSGYRYLSSVVTECLVSHDTCTGSYVGNLAAYILRCECSCHTKKGIRDSNSEPQDSSGQIKGSSA